MIILQLESHAKCILSPDPEVKVTKSRPTLCDPTDFIVHGILQARILEWIAVPFTRGTSQPKDRTQVSSTAGGYFTSWATREAQVTLAKRNTPSHLIPKTL